MIIRLIIAAQLLALTAIGQTSLLTLDQSFLIRDRGWKGDPFRQHGTFLPYVQDQANALTNTDSLNQLIEMDLNGVWNYWMNPVKTGKKGFIGVWPLVGLGGAAGNVSGDTTMNTGGAFYQGGICVKANYGDKLSSSLSFLGQTGNYPFYARQLRNTTGSLPVVGKSNNVVGGIASTYLNGFISYRALKPVTLTLGNGRNFIGNGYRSMLLSDFGANYPYLRITTRFWHIQYTNLYAKMKQFRPDGKADEKYMVMHHLSWNVTRWLNVGLFESIVWQARDSNYYRGFDWHYANPLLFYRPIEYAVGSSDNALIGADVSIHTKKLKLYGQVMLDEFLLKEVKADVKHRLNPSDTSIQWGWWANKYAIQAGVLLKDIVWPGMSIRAEFNTARPYMYSHGSVTQNYGHANLPLAHPLGANFKEFIVQVQYNKARWSFDVTAMIAKIGKDSAGYFSGADVFRSYLNRSDSYYNYTGQGKETDINNLIFNASYLLSPASDMKLFAQVVYRMESHGNDLKDSFISIGIRSCLSSRGSLY